MVNHGNQLGYDPNRSYSPYLKNFRLKKKLHSIFYGIVSILSYVWIARALLMFFYQENNKFRNDYIFCLEIQYRKNVRDYFTDVNNDRRGRWANFRRWTGRVLVDTVDGEQLNVTSFLYP